MDPRKRARLISVVPQAASLPAGYTVYETDSHGRTPYLNWYGKLRPTDEQIIGNAVRITGLEPFQEKEVSGLSGGEQQRVSIARALCKNPVLLLCDEPTGALDYQTGKSILRLLAQLCTEKHMTVVIITHNSTLAAMANRVIRIKNGRIVSNEVNTDPKSVEDIEW